MAQKSQAGALVFLCILVAALVVAWHFGWSSSSGATSATTASTSSQPPGTIVEAPSDVYCTELVFSDVQTYRGRTVRFEAWVMVADDDDETRRGVVLTFKCGPRSEVAAGMVSIASGGAARTYAANSRVVIQGRMMGRTADGVIIDEGQRLPLDTRVPAQFPDAGRRSGRR